MISNKICKLMEHKDCVYYRASCNCGHPEHYQDLLLEKWGNLIWLEIEYSGRQASFWERIKFLVTGRIKSKYFHEFTFGPENIRDYIKALEEGLSYLEKEDV